MTAIPVIVQGLGPIGRRILLGAERDPRLEVVGAVDIAPALAGRAVSEVVPGARLDAPVRDSFDEVPAPDGSVVLQATGSWVPDVAPQLRDALAHGFSVVSTCEELVWPWRRHPELSSQLDREARTAGRTLVATGVNPGFMMDQLIVALTGVTHDVRAVHVERVIDPRARRVQFQQKIGLEISRSEYEQRAATGKFGHVGLRESGELAAVGLGWRIDDWEESILPVQPDEDGPVLGLIQTLEGRTSDGHTLALRFEVHGGISESYDRIVVDGTPPLRLEFPGGVFGDDATAAAVLRAARVIPRSPHGLVSVLDLPLK